MRSGCNWLRVIIARRVPVRLCTGKIGCATVSLEGRVQRETGRCNGVMCNGKVCAKGRLCNGSVCNGSVCNGDEVCSGKVYKDTV